MANRRDFIKQAAAASLLLTPNRNFWIGRKSKGMVSGDRIWSCLIHLSFNMWEEYPAPDHEREHVRIRSYNPNLRFHEKLWDDVLLRMQKQGINMVLIDLGDAIKYRSHPEIALQDAWTTDFLKKQLDKVRNLGIEPIPKLNFSAGHDTWLGDYAKMLSTPKYYDVCRNLIAEVAELFDRPRFIHIGMDEETAEHQIHYKYVVVRKAEMWWHDFHFLVNEVERQGARSWIWSDYVWRHPEEFFEKMPKSVVQSNWYYGSKFDLNLPSEDDKEEYWKTYVGAYYELEAHGYDQIPCGGYYGPRYVETNMLDTVKLAKQHIRNDHLKGFLITNWVPTVETFRDPILKAVDLMGDAKRWFESNG